MENKSTEFIEFFEMIKELGKKSKEDNWSFMHFNDIYNRDFENLNFPMVSYKIKAKESMEGRNRKSRRVAGEPDSRFTVRDQAYDCLVEFYIIGRDYFSTNKHRVWFERFLETHRKELNELGIFRFYFVKQGEDQVLELNNQDFLYQPLTYRLSFEYDYRNVIGTLADIKARVNKIIEQ